MVIEATFNARVFSEGKITIPSTTRSILNIKDDDYVKVTLSKVEVDTTEHKEEE